MSQTNNNFDMYVCDTVQTRGQKQTEARIQEAFASGRVQERRGVRSVFTTKDEEDKDDDGMETRMWTRVAAGATMRTKVLCGHVTVRRR